MEHWTELRSALLVAQKGTVMEAASALNIHRATVNRHIDYLEAKFDVKLFQRHSRGYELTEVGQLFLDVVGRADEMFLDLTHKLNSHKNNVSGNFLITAISGITPLMMPAINDFKQTHPDVKVHLESTVKLARLEVGEAHLAIRVGPKPKNPDYVVQLFCNLPFGLYASETYIRQFGLPSTKQFEGHHFVSIKDENDRYPFTSWFKKTVHNEQISLETDDLFSLSEAVKAGTGLGFLGQHDAEEKNNLRNVRLPDCTFSIPIWIVTHVDLHRTSKVQSFTKILKKHAEQLLY